MYMQYTLIWLLVLLLLCVIEHNTTAVQPGYNELDSELNNSTLHRNNSATVNTTVSSTSSSTTSHISSIPSTTDHVQPTTHPLVVVPSVTIPVVKHTISSSITVATPTPAGSRVITVATDAVNRNKEITLPTNSVKIFASTWPELSKSV